MTHNDILKKFMIEYDKADITSSYPSLTKTEKATLLNKAYLALIAQKITGVNQRKSGFESDIKAIEDLRPLLTTTSADKVQDAQFLAKNEQAFAIPMDLLYFVQVSIQNFNGDTYNTPIATHELAANYKNTGNNIPWVDGAIAYVTGDQIRVLTDGYAIAQRDHRYSPRYCYVTYIKKPAKFDFILNENNDIQFELSDTMAEELINLAIVFATEITESPRLQTKTTTLSLES